MHCSVAVIFRNTFLRLLPVASKSQPLSSENFNKTFNHYSNLFPSFLKRLKVSFQSDLTITSPFKQTKVELLCLKWRWVSPLPTLLTTSQIYPMTCESLLQSPDGLDLESHCESTPNCNETHTDFKASHSLSPHTSHL